MRYAVTALKNPYTDETMYQVLAEDGCPWPYIYKQKRAVHYKTWAKWVTKRLIKFGYEYNEINEVLWGCTKTRCYINKYYYVQPHSVTQRVLELGIQCFIDETGGDAI